MFLFTGRWAYNWGVRGRAYKFVGDLISGRLRYVPTRLASPPDVLWGSFVTHSFLPHGEKWGKSGGEMNA